MKKNIRNLLRFSAAGGLGLAALSGLSVQAVAAAPLLADISINVGIDPGPPPPPVEVIVASPGPGFVWIGGFWDGSPGHYRWARGHWDRPPHGNTRWEAPRWERGNDGHYRKVEGHWR